MKSIETLRDIERIREILNHRPRDLLLFDIATQTGLPGKRLLQLRVKDLLKLNIGDKLSVLVGRSFAWTPAIMNEIIYRTFRNYMSSLRPAGEDYLFKSRKGSRPLSITSASRLVKGWFNEAGIESKGALLTLRKTWEHHYRDNYRMGEKVIQEKNVRKVLKPAKSKNIQEVVYSEILKAIVSGQLPPGNKIIMGDMAREMEVSQIPIREAVGKLEAIGLIENLRRGRFVKELTEKNLREILKLRLVFETMIARNATLNCNDETLRQLEILNNQYLNARNRRDVDEQIRRNRKFHFRLYKDSNMPILYDIINSLWDKTSPYLYFYRETEELEKSPGKDNHEGILEGMKNRDPDNVCRWLEKDISYAAESVLKSMSRAMLPP